MAEKEIKIFYPENKSAWRNWLETNHQTEQSVWLVFYTKASNKPSVTWSEAVDEALCFGWIDSKKVSIDKERSHQFFSKRKPSGTWSKINKEKVEKLIADGLMTEAGFYSIERAKQNGSWTILDEVEELIIPADLEKEFYENPDAKEFYLSLSKSSKKIILSWLVFAKTTETRQKRIREIIDQGNMKQKPKHMV
ncbi:MAG: YdeI/OmpD-associated family protein [Saprospiraceae bacterium]|nr:YdeI/OmpD-associated family protein [Saprospiraceae bacterium]